MDLLDKALLKNGFFYIEQQSLQGSSGDSDGPKHIFEQWSKLAHVKGQMQVKLAFGRKINRVGIALNG